MCVVYTRLFSPLPTPFTLSSVFVVSATKLQNSSMSHHSRTSGATCFVSFNS